MGYIIILPILTVLFSLMFRAMQEPRKDKSDYRELADGLWITPHGIQDFNDTTLPLEYQFHNREVEIQKQRDENEWQWELIKNKMDARLHIWFDYGKEVDKLSVEQKMSYLQEWIDYTVDCAIDKPKLEEIDGVMCFDMFVAQKICPCPYLYDKTTFRIQKGYITYA